MSPTMRRADAEALLFDTVEVVDPATGAPLRRRVETPRYRAHRELRAAYEREGQTWLRAGAGIIAGPVGVAVHEAGDARGAQCVANRVGRDVHQRFGCVRGVLRAALTRLCREGPARRERLSEEACLPGRRARLPAELLVRDIAGAQRIAVQQQRRHPFDGGDVRLRQQDRKSVV